MKVVKFCWLLLFLSLVYPTIAQQDIEIIDNIAFKKGKIEKVNIVYQENNCIDVWLKYIGDCADQLDIYIDSTFYESKYIPNGSRLDEPYIFSITGLKGDELIDVLVHFIDCAEPEPILPPPVVIQSRDPCEPCLADCDSSGIYAFYDQFHNGWFKATTLPLNEVRTGFGWYRKWLSSLLVLSTDLQIGILDYKWIEDFDVNQYYYGAFFSGLTINSGLDFSWFKVIGGLDINLSYDYENSEIDYKYYRLSALINIWKLLISGEQEKYDLVQLYRVRSSTGYYNRAKFRIGYQDNLTTKFSYTFGYQTSISKYDDELYTRKHQPKWIGGFLTLNFCAFPFDLNVNISYESGDEIEFYKIDQILVDPPIDIFDISLNVKYFLF